VPKDATANATWRREIAKATANSRSARARLERMCADDLLFWLNTFCNVYEPRAVSETVLPFVTWGFQDECFTALDAELTAESDVGIEKSRTMSATWMVLAFYVWLFQFRPYMALGITSRDKNCVDRRGDPDSLFWKIDFLIDQQPEWLQSDVRSIGMNRENRRTHGAISGEEATPDMFRSGRRRSIFMDEIGAFQLRDGYAAMNATQAATNVRIAASTPKGAVGAFYDAMHSADSTALAMRLHWRDHPLYNRGLYTFENGRLVYLDSACQYQASYPFVTDGKVRSPWYDRECKRLGANDTLISQELDICYLGSGSPFFGTALLERVFHRDVRAPLKIGNIETVGSGVRFVEDSRGSLRLWFYPDPSGNPPHDRDYGMGIDVSEGTGATPSVVAIVDRRTAAQVGEYADAHVTPERFSEKVKQLGEWFCGPSGPAYAKWESNGPGRPFGIRLRDLGYGNCFMRMGARGSRYQGNEIAGWAATQAGVRDILTELRRALESGDYTLRSQYALDDCRLIVYAPGGIAHLHALATRDPSGARENHADYARGHALAWSIVRQFRDDPGAAKPEEPDMCIARRMRMYEDAHKPTIGRRWI
jgi:hypothetical protein